MTSICLYSYFTLLHTYFGCGAGILRIPAPLFYQQTHPTFEQEVQKISYTVSIVVCTHYTQIKGT